MLHNQRSSVVNKSPMLSTMQSPCIHSVGQDRIKTKWHSERCNQTFDSWITKSGPLLLDGLMESDGPHFVRSHSEIPSIYLVRSIPRTGNPPHSNMRPILIWIQSKSPRSLSFVITMVTSVPICGPMLFLHQPRTITFCGISQYVLCFPNWQWCTGKHLVALSPI